MMKLDFKVVNRFFALL